MRRCLSVYIVALGSIVVLGSSSFSMGVLLVANEWEEKSYAEWSREATIAMLTSSPWATREVIHEEKSVGVPSSGAESSDAAEPATSSSTSGESTSLAETQKGRTYSITFMSARPIRMALARWALLTGNVSREKAEQFLSQNSYGDAIVIAVAVPHGQDDSELENVKAETLRNTTFLHLEKSGRQLHLVRYVPPSQSGNNGGLFFFPGSKDDQPTVTVEEREIRFETRISDTIRFNEEFNLEEMLFKGELEL